MRRLIEGESLLFEDYRASRKLHFHFDHFYNFSVFVLGAQVHVSANRFQGELPEFVELLSNQSRQTIAVFDVDGMNNSMHKIGDLRTLSLPASRMRPLNNGL